MVVAPELLSDLNAEQLRELARDLIAQISNRDQQIASLDQAISSKDREILYRQAKIDQLTHEMAVLKRWKFGRSREQLDAGQVSLLDETIDADIAAIEQELQDLAPPDKAAKEPRQSPKRAALPPELPRVELHRWFWNARCGNSRVHPALIWTRRPRPNRRLPVPAPLGTL